MTPASGLLRHNPIRDSTHGEPLNPLPLIKSRMEFLEGGYLSEVLSVTYHYEREKALGPMEIQCGLERLYELRS